jgi:membrane-associated phospholipid phosphatase
MSPDEICLHQNIYMNFQLPAIDNRKKWFWAASGYIGFCLFYTLAGNLHWRPPATIFPAAIDGWLPFMDWTIWIYHSQFVLLLCCIAAIKEPENLSATLYAMALASLLSFAIFLLYPTTIPRTAQTGDGLTAKAFQILYAIDSAANCFPSLHVSLAWLAATAVRRENNLLGAPVMLWAFLISLSTLTTKQHYFVDVLGGLGVAALSRLAVVKFARKDGRF